MGVLTAKELAGRAAALGLSLDQSRIRALLPEVERMLEAAKRLGELPIDPAEPPRSGSGS